MSTERFFAAVEGRWRVRVIADMRPLDISERSPASSAATTQAGQVFAERFLESSGAAAQLRGFARAIRDGVAPCSTLEDVIETQVLAREIDEKLA